MPRPGTDIYISDDVAPGGPSLDTGQSFFAGVAERGPADRAVKVTSLKTYRDTFGARSGGSLLYDAVGAFFSEGGATLYVSRLVAADADSATAAFGTATVNAVSPGEWGNEIELTAAVPTTLLELTLAAALPQAAGDPIVAIVSYGGAEVERSTVLTDVDGLVTWAQGSRYVRVVKGADNVLPAAATTAALAGGTAGAATTASDLAAALARFDYALGPGQVAAPGMSSSGSHDELLAHADDRKRCALLDLPDTGDVNAVAAAVTALYGIDGARFAAAYGPWAIYPAETSPATVTIPYSGIQAGLIARSDALGNPNQAAAGVNGISRLALGLSQTYTDEHREALNEIGVTLAKPVYGDVRTYGGRTVAGPDDRNWLWFGNSRVVMAVAHEADAIAERYVLRQIDGRRQLFAAFETDLRGMLLGYYRTDALYGATPEEAFTVDTGEGINTTETIANGEVHAAIYVKCSPAAEWVRIDIVKVPIERALPTAA